VLFFYFCLLRGNLSCVYEELNDGEAFEDLDDPAVSVLRHAIVEAKQHWSVIGW
jgi:hypothetical protein